MTGGIARPYLTSYLGGKVEVTLNDGRCPVRQRDDVYYFQASRQTSECGTEKQASCCSACTSAQYKYLMYMVVVCPCR